MFEDDGEAIELIIAAGGSVRRGIIKYTGRDHFVWLAIQYLCREWDHAVSEAID